MATFDQRYTINGLVRTDQTVWENIEKMAEAASAWVAYDTYAGKYAVVINEADNAVTSWTEADIIGPISISGSSLTNLYNAIEIEYLKSELQDQVAYHRLELPGSLRNQFEPDNTLQITNEFINNDIQAQLIANITLRQSRLDKLVTVVTDWSKTGLQAGDIIDISSDTYGWVNKEFRIMRVRELEGDDGGLRLEFQCLEYDDDIYDEGDLSDFLVDGTPGIRSITAIGVPGTPTVELVTLDSLPAQRVSSTVPAGIVERMQFWAANVAITGNVANSTFQLYGSLASPDAAAWTVNAAATFTTTALRDGTWVWKTRGVNALGVGPFSDGSGNVDFVRTQVPDAILAGTQVVSSTGNVYFPVVGGPSLGGDLADCIQYTGNSVYKPMIYTADGYMYSINGNVANVSGGGIPSGSMTIDSTIDVTVYGALSNAVIGNNAIGIYVSKAPWDAAEYAANGFSGLNWTAWTPLNTFNDKDQGIPVDAAANVRISLRGLNTFDFNAANTEIIAVGYSTQLVPTPQQYTLQVDPISGITRATYLVDFVGNTVVLDQGVGYEIPGITAANTLFAGGLNVNTVIRFDI